jgi:hypothetical protein
MPQFLETQGLAMLRTMEKKDMKFTEGKLDRYWQWNLRLKDKNL